MTGMADVGSADLVTGGKPLPTVKDGLHFDEDVIDLAIHTSLGWMVFFTFPPGMRAFFGRIIRILL